MTQFLDQATNNPNVDPLAYRTNDPFFLTFDIPIESHSQGGVQIAAGELYLWLTPRPWEPVADDQLNIFGASINGVRMIEHVPATLSSPVFYLEGAAAKAVYESLKRDEKVTLQLDLATNQVVSREVPPGEHFSVLSAMLETCHRARAPSAANR